MTDRLSSNNPAGSIGPAKTGVDTDLFTAGTHPSLWRWLGAHYVSGEGTTFRVWAPNAIGVNVVGEFNGWDQQADNMETLTDSGVWEITLANAVPGQRYKFSIIGRDHDRVPLKADPFAVSMERSPATASIIAAPSTFIWQDDEWLASRKSRADTRAPISIYEVHSASWRRRDTGDYLSFRELAAQLIPYVCDLGFTHIQLMPMSEYPFDGSWGYQPVGLFAPTSRHGTADDYRCFINACHRAGLGVLQDWVPAHFPSDAHGLGRFDGNALYEHEDPRKGFHNDWHTYIYNFGRPEVDSFLLSNALYWLEEFHIDGLRVDAVASMLYLDYSRADGQWIPNSEGGNENFEAIALLRKINAHIAAMDSGCVSIAEESTAWPGVSAAIARGGLGFQFKWNMGWMHDTLRYMSHDPCHRQYHQNDLTFGIDYAFSENFVLPLSHDEVVHCKGSLLERMPGDVWQRFANLRAYFAFMWTHPGKKLLFMGGEFAQPEEWNHDAQLNWRSTEQREHRCVQHLIRDLNSLYRQRDALHELDCDAAGFEWIAADDTRQSVIAFLRKSAAGDTLLIVCNFTPVPREKYRLGVPSAGDYALLLNSDDNLYGGSGHAPASILRSEPKPMHGRGQSVTLLLPPLATMVYEAPVQ